jgi:hypothetical protein
LHVAVAAVAIACTARRANPGPPPSVPVDSTTVSTQDPALIDLGHVAGHTTVTVVMGPGPAMVNGTVVDPTGQPVAGAVVHVERVVDGNVASTNVSTQPDGTWSVPNVLGGQYRVRGWRAPDLAVTDPAVFFLAQSDTHSVPLQLVHFGGTQATSALAPSPPIIGEPAQLAVQVTTSSVGDDGVVRSAPIPRATVQLFGTGRWGVKGSTERTADAAGVVAWEITCEDLGPQALSVVVNSADVFPLDMAPCSPVPTTTTTTAASTTTVGGRTTTTTRRSHLPGT